MNDWIEDVYRFEQENSPKILKSKMALVCWYGECAFTILNVSITLLIYKFCISIDSCTHTSGKSNRQHQFSIE